MGNRCCARGSGAAAETPVSAVAGEVSPPRGGHSQVGFNTATKKSDNLNDSKAPEHNEDEPDDFVPTPEFAPVIPLPPLVEAKKGDEGDNVIHEVRAKLFRFDTTVKEWKERGIGNMKIVQNKVNQQQVRVLMWRERVLKLACNHLINGDMVINYAQKSEKHLTWTAMDYSEPEMEPEVRLEKFLCKFANEVQCSEFKKHFEDMVKFLSKTLVSSSPSESAKPEMAQPQPDSNVGNQSTTDQVTDQPTQPEFAMSASSRENLRPLSEIFRKPEGSWSCSDCYTSNNKDSTVCAACNAPNPNSPTKEASTLQQDTTPFASFSFKPIGFGDLSDNSTSSIFGNSTSTTGFSSLAGAGQPLFGLNAATKKSDNLNDSKAPEHNEDEPDDFVPTPEFAPVIPLPPLVEAKKGDEGDNVIHEVRAKLFRFDTTVKEWKERGIGNMKIVQNKVNQQQVRVLMWRERVLKLACNHLINGDMVINYAQKSEKHLTWTAMDYSEPEMEPEVRLEKFLCKFANEVQCSEFKKHFEDMVKFLSKTLLSSSPSESAKPEMVEPIQPPQPSPEKTIQQDNDGSESSGACPGCPGCDPDSFDFGQLDNRELPTYPEQTMTIPELLLARQSGLISGNFKSFM